MKAEVVGFIAVLLATILAARILPGALGLSEGAAQERILLAALPVLVIFIWRSYRTDKNGSGGELS